MQSDTRQLKQIAEEIIAFVTKSSIPATNLMIARALGFKRDRDIQGLGEGPGILEQAREYAFRKYKLFLVTNFSGSIITRDINRAREWIAPFYGRNKHSWETMQNYEKRFKEAESAPIQLSLL